MIVGSEMGNAEMVGDVVKEDLEERGYSVEMTTEPELGELDFAAPDLVLLVTSTTGLGEVPQNIEPFYDALVADRPDLAGVRFGLVGLGDRNYKDTYCGGPKRLQAIFAELGAECVGEPLLLDATDHPAPDEDAVEWLPSWLEAAGVT